MKHLISEFKHLLLQHQNTERYAEEVWRDQVRTRFYSDFVRPTDRIYIRFIEEIEELDREVSNVESTVQSLLAEAD